MKFRVIALVLLLCLALCACNSASDPVVTDPTNAPSATEPSATDPEPTVQATDPDTGIPSLTVAPEGSENSSNPDDSYWGNWGDTPIVFPEDEFSDDDMEPMVTVPTTSPDVNPDEEQPTEATTPPATESSQNDGSVVTLPEDVFED